MKGTPVYRVLRVLAGMILLAWLVAWVDWRQLISAVRRCDPSLVMIGIGAFSVATLPAAVRLQLLFHPLALTFGRAFRLTLSSYLFNQLLPTGLGGDAYRSIHLKRSDAGWLSVIGLVTFERVVGALSLAIPAFAYAVASPGRSQLIEELRGFFAGTRASIAVFAIAVAAVVAGMILLIPCVRRRLGGLGHEIRVILQHLSPATILGVVVLSLAFHGLRVCGMLAFLEAAGREIPVGDLLIVMAVTLVASLIPISIGALGVREGILVYALAAYGIPRAEGLTIALLNRLVVVLLASAGGIVFYSDRRHRPVDAPATEG